MAALWATDLAESVRKCLSRMPTEAQLLAWYPAMRKACVGHPAEWLDMGGTGHGRDGAWTGRDSSGWLAVIQHIFWLCTSVSALRTHRPFSDGRMPAPPFGLTAFRMGSVARVAIPIEIHDLTPAEAPISRATSANTL